MKRLAAKRYAVTALDGLTDTWARSLRSRIERADALRDPLKYPPKLMFAGDWAVKNGVTDAALAALPELATEEIAALRIEAAVLHEGTRTQVREKARSSRLAPRRPLAEVIRHVSDMAHDEPTGTVVDGLIYEQMVIHWVGDGGTYKTFTVLALACSVAAGHDFTHRLKVPEKQPVLYLCAERRHYGLGADVDAWCKTNQLDISDLLMAGWDDVVQLADDEWMAELTGYVIAQGVKLIVFDTQRTATRGIEENSSTDIGAALANAQKLAMAANAAVIIIHHTTRGQDHARGTSAGRDDTDATVLQKATGPNEAEFIIDKHKSEATGTHYPIKVAKVSGTVPPTEGRAGYGYTTLVAAARDPLSMDETAERVHAALSHDDKILVAVINDNDGPPLSPAEVERRASAQGCTLKKDAVRDHLRTLARPGYGFFTEKHDPVTGRRAYSPKASATTTADTRGGGEDVSADVVDLASRRHGGKAAPPAPNAD